jgi:hypothetical protein
MKKRLFYIKKIIIFVIGISVCSIIYEINLCFNSKFI